MNSAGRQTHRHSSSLAGISRRARRLAQRYLVSPGNLVSIGLLGFARISSTAQ